MVDTFIWSRSFVLVSMDFSYTTSYTLSIVNFCSRMHRLATIQSVQTDNRQTDAILYSKRDCTKYGRLKTITNINSRTKIGIMIMIVVFRYYDGAVWVLWW